MVVDQEDCGQLKHKERSWIVRHIRDFCHCVLSWQLDKRWWHR